MNSPIIKRQRIDNILEIDRDRLSNIKKKVSDDDDASEFETLVTKSWYVDKTLLIKTIIENQDGRTLITAPTKFCKTANMNMLRKFFEITVNKNGKQIKLQFDETGQLKPEQLSPNFKLFADKNLKIFQDQPFFTKYFGTFPTIHVDFSRMSGDNFDEIFDNFRDLLHEIFRKHGYLLNSDQLNAGEKRKFTRYYDPGKLTNLTEREIESGLAFLSECFYKHFDRNGAFVLIDEYDTPIWSAIYNKNFTEEDLSRTVTFIRNLKSNLLNNMDFVERALLNATHNIEECCEHFPFLTGAQFSKFYGFTTEEVKTMLENRNLGTKFDEINFWYSYNYNNYYNEIYNPCSILNYLEQGRVGNYWTPRNFEPIKTLLTQNNMQKIYKFKELMAKKVVRIKSVSIWELINMNRFRSVINAQFDEIDEKGFDLFMQFLYEKGLLYIDFQETTFLELKIANTDIYYQLCEVLFSRNYFINYYNIDLYSIKSFTDSLKCLQKIRSEKSFMQLAQSVQNLYKDSKFLPQTEFEFQATLFCLIQNEFPDSVQGHAFTMPKELGSGADLAVIVDGKQGCRSGLMVELKLFGGGGSVEALRELVDHRYYEVFLQEQENIDNEFYVGLHMNKKRIVSVSYLNNSICMRFVKTVLSN